VSSFELKYRKNVLREIVAAAQMDYVSSPDSRARRLSGRRCGESRWPNRGAISREISGGTIIERLIIDPEAGLLVGRRSL